MHDASSNKSWLILAKRRCSDKLRELSQAQHWPVIEYTDDFQAARSVVAMGAEYVVVEACQVSMTLPVLAKTIAALDITEYVVCIATNPTAHMERDAAGCGVLLCDSVDCFAEYLGLLQPLLMHKPHSSIPHPAPTKQQNPPSYGGTAASG